jgi:hypothetical protein
MIIHNSEFTSSMSAKYGTKAFLKQVYKPLFSKNPCMKASILRDYFAAGDSYQSWRVNSYGHGWILGKQGAFLFIE